MGDNNSKVGKRKSSRRVSALAKNYYQDSDSEQDDVMIDFIDFEQHSISHSRRKSRTLKRKRGVIRKPTTTNQKHREEAAVARSVLPKTICLDTDHNESVTSVIIPDTLKDSYAKSVQLKVDTFFKSGLLSSDEEDEVPIKTVVPAEPIKESKDFYVLSDSDEELPSTSNVKKIEEPIMVVESSNNKNDDLMDIVDKILVENDIPVEINTSNIESDNWNEFKSKADEIMGSVTAILDTFNDNKNKTKEKPCTEVSPAKTKPSCPVCLETLDGSIVAGATVCGHIFCLSCIKEVAKISKSCPTCRKRITVRQIHPLYL